MPIIPSAGAHAYWRREYPGTPTPHQPWLEKVEEHKRKWHAHVEKLMQQLAEEKAAKEAEDYYQECKAKYGVTYDWYLAVRDSAVTTATTIKARTVECCTRKKPPPRVIHPWHRRPEPVPEGALKEGEKECRLLDFRIY